MLLCKIRDTGARKWDRTGRITEVLPHRQYHVRMDGSGCITLRNRRFIREYTAGKPPLIYPLAIELNIKPNIVAPTVSQPKPIVIPNTPAIPRALQRLASCNNPGLFKAGPAPTSRT